MIFLHTSYTGKIIQKRKFSSLHKLKITTHNDIQCKHKDDVVRSNLHVDISQSSK